MIGDMLKDYKKLLDERDKKKEELARIEEKLQFIEDNLLDAMLKEGIEKTAIEDITVFVKTNKYYSIKDKQKLYEFVKQSPEAFAIMYQRINTLVAKDLIKEGEESLYGLAVEERPTLLYRRIRNGSKND